MADLAAAAGDSLQDCDPPGEVKTPAYEYDSLDDPESDIRLCTILPARSDSNDTLIRLRIESCRLTDAKDEYDAVSYTWGSDEHLNKVLVNDQYMLLRNNVYHFLLHCRENSLQHLPKLWIDSICINQSDSGEKSHQVRFMKEIFSSAHTVLIWLPEESPRQGISDVAQKQGLGSEPSLVMWERLFSVDARRRHPIIERELRLLLLSMYWRRLWILQEVVVAQRPKIVSGVHLLDFLCLVSLNFFDNWVEDVQGAERVPMSNPEKQCIMSIGTIKQYRGQPQPKIFGLLEGAGMNLCADIRDRVYGVLGILEDYRMIKVDYEADIEQLLCQVLQQVQYENNRQIELYHAKVVLTALDLDYEQLHSYCATSSSDKAATLQNKQYDLRIAVRNAYSLLPDAGTAKHRGFPLVLMGQSLDSASLMRRHSTRLKSLRDLVGQYNIAYIEYEFGRSDYFFQLNDWRQKGGRSQEYSAILESAGQVDGGTAIDNGSEPEDPIPTILTRPFTDKESAGFTLVHQAGLGYWNEGIPVFRLRCSALFLAWLLSLPGQGQYENLTRLE